MNLNCARLNIGQKHSPRLPQVTGAAGCFVLLSACMNLHNVNINNYDESAKDHDILTDRSWSPHLSRPSLPAAPFELITETIIFPYQKLMNRMHKGDEQNATPAMVWGLAPKRNPLPRPSDSR